MCIRDSLNGHQRHLVDSIDRSLHSVSHLFRSILDSYTLDLSLIHISAFFSRYDLLLTPTLPDLAPALGVYAAGADTMDGHQWTDRVFGSSPFTPVFNAAGLPAMSVPLFQDAATGLPIGMQFVAPAGREDVLFQVAGQLERSLPWAARQPGVWASTENE